MLRIVIVLLTLFAATFVHSAAAEKLIVTNSKAWKPFSFINYKGEPEGILIDYWREYGEKNQVEIEFLLLDWQASLDAVRDGHADVHAGLLWSEQRESYLDYAPDIFSIDTQMYISQELLGLNLDEFLLGDHKQQVGVVAGGYEEGFTRLHYPNLNLKLYRNNQLMIDAAFDGEINAFIADLQVANFYILSSDEPQRFMGVRHFYSGDLRPAVKEGRAELQKQVTQGLDNISLDDKQKILNRWMYVRTVYPDFLLPAAALIIGLTTLGYIVTLNLTVKVRTKALEQANLELKKLSETDQLTELSNRRHFVEVFQQRLKTGHSIAVMVFDIDDFKQVNDNFGHHIGDIVIKNVAQAASNTLTERDFIGRIGGEEFAVLATELSFEESISLAERICNAVREVNVGDANSQRVTISLGCAYYANQDYPITLSDADHLMYQSKQSGKDKMTAHQYA